MAHLGVNILMIHVAPKRLRCHAYAIPFASIGLGTKLIFIGRGSIQGKSKAERRMHTKTESYVHPDLEKLKENQNQPQSPINGRTFETGVLLNDTILL